MLSAVQVPQCFCYPFLSITKTQKATLKAEEKFPDTEDSGPDSIKQNSRGGVVRSLPAIKVNVLEGDTMEWVEILAAYNERIQKLPLIWHIYGTFLHYSHDIDCCSEWMEGTESSDCGHMGDYRWESLLPKIVSDPRKGISVTREEDSQQVSPFFLQIFRMAFRMYTSWAFGQGRLTHRH